MIAEADPDLFLDHGSGGGDCTWHKSRGVREVVLPCQSDPEVFWDLNTDGGFRWWVQRWDITGDEHRVGDEYILGFKEFQPIDTPAPPEKGVRVYATHANTLNCVFPDGTDWRIAPYPEATVSAYTDARDGV